VRFLSITLICMLLSACAMPLGLRIVTLMADGASVVSTKKTVSDHVLSSIAKRDCAMWRVMKKRKPCRR
jgi:hypothetical protein